MRRCGRHRAIARSAPARGAEAITTVARDIFISAMTADFTIAAAI